MLLPLLLSCLVGPCASVALAAPAAAAEFTPRRHSLTVMAPNDGARAYDASFGNGNWAALSPYVDLILMNRSHHIPASMKTMMYLDVGMCSNLTGPGRNEYPFPDCSDWPAAAFYAQPEHPERLLSAKFNGFLQRPGDPRSEEMRAHTLAAVEHALGTGDDDLIQFDDSAPPEESYGAFCWGTPSFAKGTGVCEGAPGGQAHAPYGGGPAGWSDGMKKLIAALPRPAVINGLAGYAGHGMSATAALTAEAPNAWGGLCDGCFYGGEAVPHNRFLWSGPVFLARLDAAMRVTAAGKNVILVDGAVTDPAARARALADAMLVYDPDRTWFWYGPCGPHSHIAVCPEAALTFYRPVSPYPKDSHGVEAPGGAFVREFEACYDAGQPVGPCAAVVNPDSYAALPRPKLRHVYAHALRISGDSLCVCYGDEGSLDLKAPAAPDPLPAASGYVLFK